MTAREVLALARQRGVSLVVANGLIRLRGPRMGLTSDLREAVRRHKATLIRLLSSPEPEKPCVACGGWAFWQSQWGHWVCEVCHPAAPGVVEIRRSLRIDLPTGGAQALLTLLGDTDALEVDDHAA